MIEGQEFWDRRPCNIRHSAKPVGTREYFEEVSQRRYFVEPHIPGFAQFERWKGKRVLEIGCGIGTDAAEFMQAGAKYSGIDISAKSIDIARQRRDLFGLRGSFVHGEIDDINQEYRADLIYSFGVIHHTPDPKEVIKQARGAIGPDGEFRLMLYAANSWKAALIDAGLDQPEAQAGCPIARTYTPQQVVALLHPYFAAETIHQTHIFPWKIEDYVQHRYVKQPWFEAMRDDVFQALQQRFGWHLLIVAKPI